MISKHLSKFSFLFIATLLLLAFQGTVPGRPAKDLPVPLRVSCGGPDVGKTGSADYWQSDKPFLEKGDKYSFKNKISTKGVKNPAPQKVYLTVRRDSPQWHFAGLPDGDYLVRLHFSDSGKKSDRRMSFWFQDLKLIENFSVNKAAGGSSRAFVYEVIVAVSGGDGLRIRAGRGEGDDAFLAGLEILPAPKGAEPTPELEDRTTRPANLDARIRRFTGGPTRIVWTRSPDASDIFSEKPHGRLFAFDTEDGKGERCVLSKPDSYARPFLTPDGKRIVFSNNVTHRCLVVDFNGGGLHEFAPGFAPCLWTDPSTHETWVCVREKIGKGSTEVIVRRKLDAPDVSERIWTTSDDGRSVMSHFHLMSDGNRAVDCNPWPDIGTIELGRGRYHMVANGCWPDISPDDSGRFFTFRGNHRSVMMFDDFRSKGRRVSIDTIPDAPRPNVYHPNWTNHPRYITVTAPQARPDTRLYLGRFDKSYSGIEAWRQITYGNEPDFFGDAWIANSPVITAAPRKIAAKSPADSEEPSVTQRKGLVFLWENQHADNAITDASGKTIRTCRGTLHGHARPSATQGADIRDGSLDADEESSKALAEACAKSGAISISYVTEISGPLQNGVVACYGNPGRPAQILVEAAGGKMQARLGAASVSLGEIISGKPQGWTLAFDGKTVRTFRGGSLVHSIARDAHLSSLEPALLRFGHDADGKSPWRGCIGQIEVSDRAPGADEIMQRQSALEMEWALRKPAPRVVVEAELLQASKTEDPENIRPYRRSLSENLFRVRKVLSGKLKAEKFIGLQWSILDAQHVGVTHQPGELVTINLEAEEAHPELGGEHRTSDLIEPDLPVLYDVDS